MFGIIDKENSGASQSKHMVPANPRIISCPINITAASQIFQLLKKQIFLFYITTENS